MKLIGRRKLLVEMIFVYFYAGAESYHEVVCEVRSIDGILVWFSLFSFCVGFVSICFQVWMVT